jgi:predicted RNA binding protein YcfA (HicA-like mRNA interferase family)
VRAVSGKQFCKVLESKGWELRRIQGSHHIYAKPGHSKILTVPVHGNEDLKKGMLVQLLKDAGLTENDL